MQVLPRLLRFVFFHDGGQQSGEPGIGRTWGRSEAIFDVLRDIGLEDVRQEDVSRHPKAHRLLRVVIVEVRKRGVFYGFVDIARHWRGKRRLAGVCFYRCRVVCLQRQISERRRRRIGAENTCPCSGRGDLVCGRSGSDDSRLFGIRRGRTRRRCGLMGGKALLTGF